ncbi:MAG: A24 family peptidase [Alphaproteobacteria bacterium]|nr:A24 family peptidase [Alphaproteobacteria bacterium]
MSYIVFSFLFGFAVPYIARRFEKFMPATFAYAVYRILKPNKTVSRSKRKSDEKYKKLMRDYRLYSFGWGVATSALTYLLLATFGGTNVIWHIIFLWTMLLLMEIDKRMYLLPDILTIPLLIIGFNYAVFASQWVTFGESSLGAFVGYFLPVISSFLLVWRNKDIFGGGDIKMLAAVGAWFGFEKLLYVIVLACALFGLYAILNRKKEGAFGPAIVMASLIVLFACF